MSDKLERTARDFGQTLRNFMWQNTPTYLVIAEVTDVDEENMTISAVVDEDKAFDDMELNIFPNGGNSTILIPAIGSLIVIGFIEGLPEEPFVVATTQVDKYLISNKQGEDSVINVENDSLEIIRGSSIWRIENDKISFTADLVEINGGSNDGLVLINELTAKLNNLVTEVSAMASTFNSHTHLYTDVTPSGSTISTTQAPASAMSNPSQFDKGDYENPIVTQ